MENIARCDRTQAGSLCYIGFPDYRAVSQNHPESYRREPVLATRRLTKCHCSLGNHPDLPFYKCPNCRALVPGYYHAVPPG